MRRRPLMNSIVMTINLIIVFIICFVVFTLIGGFVSNKVFAFLAKNMSNTSSNAYAKFKSDLKEVLRIYEKSK